MTDEKDPWPADLRKQWDATWSMPHMQAGLGEMLRRLRKKSMPLIPGYDGLVLAAGEHHRAVGHQEVLDHIEKMRCDSKAKEPMPQPWTPEAYGMTTEQYLEHILRSNMS